ncbi:MAG: ATP-binding protein, partial [Pseudomonadota bacterium]
TDRKQVEKRLRSLLDAQERVAQDLHDGCIQTIYAIGLKLEECRTLIRDHPRKASKKIAGAAADLNLVIHDLRLFVLGDKRELASGDDLKAALEKATQMMGGRPPAFAVEIDAAAATSLTPDQAMHLLQIARAALSNAVRHANARTGLLSLQMRDGAISLEVSDDGVGFESEEIEKPGLGLHNIEARARKLGGRLRLVSAPDQGTRLTVEIPRAR